MWYLMLHLDYIHKNTDFGICRKHLRVRILLSIQKMCFLGLMFLVAPKTLDLIVNIVNDHFGNKVIITFISYYLNSNC